MEKKIEKFLLVISFIIRVTLIVAIIGATISRQWMTIFLASFTLVLTFLPSLIQRNYRIYLPIEFEILITLFLYGSFFLGEVHSYYERFWWWDVILHSSSAFILGLIGFLIIYILNTDKKVHLHLNSFFVALFSFSFAVSIGVIWEIFEFFMDSFFGFNMQKSGLVDTMWDLIVNSLGALIVSILGYIYMKKVKVPLLFNLIYKFTKKNPHIFKIKNKKKSKNT